MGRPFQYGSAYDLTFALEQAHVQFGRKPKFPEALASRIATLRQKALEEKEEKRREAEERRRDMAEEHKCFLLRAPSYWG
jgi:hypothetical protein